PETESGLSQPNFIEKLTTTASALRGRIHSSIDTLRVSATKHALPLSKRQQVLLAVIPILLIVGLSIYKLKPFGRRPPPPPPFEATIAMNASVPGAHLSVNGEDRGTEPLTLKLREGEYKFDATLPGYASKPVELRIEPG